MLTYLLSLTLYLFAVPGTIPLPAPEQWATYWSGTIRCTGGDREIAILRPDTRLASPVMTITPVDGTMGEISVAALVWLEDDGNQRMVPKHWVGKRQFSLPTELVGTLDGSDVMHGTATGMDDCGMFTLSRQDPAISLND